MPKRAASCAETGRTATVTEILGAGYLDLKQLLADGVGRPLIPVEIGGRLLGCQDLNPAGVEEVEMIGLGDMPVERGRLELGQNGDFMHAGVETVAQRYVDQAVLPGDRNRRLGPVARQRPQPRPAPSAQDHTEHTFVSHRSISALIL